jgi:hypothetical protein
MGGDSRQQEADHESKKLLNLAALTQEDVEAEEKIRMELVKERTHVDAKCTADNVEQDAACCQKTLGSIPHATAKEIQDLNQFMEMVE